MCICGIHCKENTKHALTKNRVINACGTVPLLDIIVAEMSVVECQKVGKNMPLCSHHCRKHLQRPKIKCITLWQSQAVDTVGYHK